MKKKVQQNMVSTAEAGKPSVVNVLRLQRLEALAMLQMQEAIEEGDFEFAMYNHFYVLFFNEAWREMDCALGIEDSIVMEGYERGFEQPDMFVQCWWGALQHE
jgi:hypothetical protein